MRTGVLLQAKSNRSVYYKLCTRNCSRGSVHDAEEGARDESVLDPSPRLCREHERLHTVEMQVYQYGA